MIGLGSDKKTTTERPTKSYRETYLSENKTYRKTYLGKRY